MNELYYLDMISVSGAWEKGFTGKGINVAVLDTGIDSSHPLLQGKVTANVNFSNESGTGDLNGHGTFVSGIVLSIAKGCNILNVKVMDGNGEGDFSSVMNGIEWCMSNRADVIVLSLGGYYNQCMDGHPLAGLISLASSKGIVLCTAVGNTGPGSETVNFPGSAHDSVSVGAVDQEGKIAEFSSRGPDFCGRIRPDCVAPGVDIVSSFPPDVESVMSGTSMASPQVAAMFAIVRQKFKKGFTKSDAEYVLSNSCTDLGTSGKDNSYGYGLINISRALNLDPSQIKGASKNSALAAIPILAGIGLVMIA